jgi:hypothetical protein
MHSLATRRIAIALLGASLACTARVESGTIQTDSATSAGGGYRTTRFGALSDTVLHLADGDSAELQSTGPARVPNEPEGLLVTYHPYTDVTDTVRMRQAALAVFDALRPKFVNGDPPWIVLRAADRPAKERNRGGRDHFFGVVLERHADGRWYPLHSATPVR